MIRIITTVMALTVTSLPVAAHKIVPLPTQKVIKVLKPAKPKKTITHVGLLGPAGGCHNDYVQGFHCH